MRPAVTVAAVALLFLVGCGDDGGDEQGEAAVEATTTTTERTVVTRPAPTTTTTTRPAFEEPTVEDFGLNVVTLEKACFGSAGCNVTYRVELSFVTDIRLDPTKVYELTYEMQGGEDVQISTIRFEDGEYEMEEDFISTESEDAVLQPVITSVRERPA